MFLFGPILFLQQVFKFTPAAFCWRAGVLRVWRWRVYYAALSDALLRFYPWRIPKSQSNHAKFPTRWLRVAAAVQEMALDCKYRHPAREFNYLVNVEAWKISMFSLESNTTPVLELCFHLNDAVAHLNSTNKLTRIFRRPWMTKRPESNGSWCNKVFTPLFIQRRFPEKLNLEL